MQGLAEIAGHSHAAKKSSPADRECRQDRGMSGRARRIQSHHYLEGHHAQALFRFLEAYPLGIDQQFGDPAELTDQCHRGHHPT